MGSRSKHTSALMSSWNSDSDQHLVGTLKVIMKSKVVKMMVMFRNIFRKAQKNFTSSLKFRSAADYA
jgi:hypothetical protein